MGNFYRMVGFQDQNSRPDSIMVESETQERPAKVLEYDPERMKAPVELNDYQAERASRYVRLEHVPDYEPAEEPPIVDQPGIDAVSTSTDDPPQTGVAPKPDQMSYNELRDFAKEEDIPGRGNKNEAELRALVADHLAQKEA